MGLLVTPSGVVNFIAFLVFFVPFDLGLPVENLVPSPGSPTVPVICVVSVVSSYSPVGKFGTYRTVLKCIVVAWLDEVDVGSFVSLSGPVRFFVADSVLDRSENTFIVCVSVGSSVGTVNGLVILDMISLLV